MSHLSDTQHEIEYGITANANTNRRINFVKFLMMKYTDLTKEIDADVEWEEFTKTKWGN